MSLNTLPDHTEADKASQNRSDKFSETFLNRSSSEVNSSDSLVPGIGTRVLHVVAAVLHDP